MSNPIIELRPFESLGSANHGWLDAHHHFSFAGYHDPARVQAFLDIHGAAMKPFAAREAAKYLT